MNLNISPDPITCANVPGGVNSVISDHALGFLSAGHMINKGKGPNIVHALARSEDIDVFHCHGLYPIGNGYFDKSYSQANSIVLNNALNAKVTICISEFSANILRHKLHIDPIVTRNGIWTKDYSKAGSPNGPILFPKAGLDANAKADPMIWLRQNSKLPLLSIAKIPGVKSTGRLDRKSFLNTLRRSSIYLGTTKENNSMATMEAMISGVPIVGYLNGFNREWLIPGEGCELVEPGDTTGLKEAILKVLGNWNKYSMKAREYAQIFDWQPVIDELLTIYSSVDKTPVNNSVSIIIPSHNYEKYLPEAIESALAQTVKCEVIVCDDKSTDKSAAIAKKYPGIRVIENIENLGVAETRNKAIDQAIGNFIVCLDADDRLHPEFVEKHLKAFTKREHAIAYAPIELVNVFGATIKKRMFKTEALPSLHAAGQNQIPSCCMFRKEFWQRAGGYEKQWSPAEDAHLWLKIFSLGGMPVRASKDPLMDYRSHPGSLSAKGFPDYSKDSFINFNSPIVERDSTVTIILDTKEGAKETLWDLEKQTFQNWSCMLQTQNSLAKIFPWLNRAAHRRGSVLQIRAGTRLSPNFLIEYMRQTPQWIQESRSP